MSVVLYEKEDRIAIITLNRPDALNSLSEELRGELNDAMIDFRDNNDLWVAIITGAGDRAFCAGSELEPLSPSGNLVSDSPSSAGAGLNVFSKIPYAWPPRI